MDYKKKYLKYKEKYLKLKNLQKKQIGGSTASSSSSSNIEPIFSANCVVCHSANGQSPPLNNYTEVKKACQQDGVLCKIQWSCDNVMPPNNKMSQTTIDMIKLWIDQGYMN